MKKITDLNNEKSLTLGKNIIFNSSWIECDEKNPDIKIGYGVKITSTQISVHTSGKLFIGDLCEIRGRIIVGPNCTVTIGFGLICNDAIFIHANDESSITIGDDCLFANPRIYSSDMHSIFDNETDKRINSSKNIVLGNKVWLSRDVLVLKGVEIGNNCIIGARSVLSGKYKESAIIAGSPAAVLKTGVSWSRNLVDKRSKILTPEFPIYRFRSAAMQFNHNEVINLAIHTWNIRDKATTEDYYVVYYLARALLLKFFRNKDSLSISVKDHIITLQSIHDALLISFENSNRKNFPCGSYAYLSALMMNNTDSAKKLYDYIKPLYKEIDSDNYKHISPL